MGFPDLATWRDLAILFLAVMWIVLLVVIVLLLLKIKGMVDDLPRRVAPILDSTQRTANNLAVTSTSIRGTISFVNRTTVTPIIRIAAIGAAATRFLQVLFQRRARDIDTEGARHG